MADQNDSRFWLWVGRLADLRAVVAPAGLVTVCLVILLWALWDRLWVALLAAPFVFAATQIGLARRSTRQTPPAPPLPPAPTLAPQATTLQTSVTKARSAISDLQVLMDRGVDIRSRLPDWSRAKDLGLPALVLSGRKPATEADVQQWIHDVESALASEPEKLAWFRVRPPDMAGLTLKLSVLSHPLRGRMDEKIRALSEIMRGVH